MNTIIVAADKNWLIGHKGSIPWHSASDFAHFKGATTNRPIIMGKRTWYGLPKRPLPNRLNIIMSHEPEHLFWSLGDGAVDLSNVLTAATTDVALQLAQSRQQYDSSEIFVIGGAQIYELFLKEDKVDRILLSRIRGEDGCNDEGDTFFPHGLIKDWKEERIVSYPEFELFQIKK